MNESKAQQEPSMEEILASIRRIIAEDEPSDGEKAEAAPDAPESDAQESDDVLELTDVAEEEPADGEKAKAAPDAPESDAQESDDVLELTDVAEDKPEAAVAEEAIEQVEEETAEADVPAEEDPVEEEIDFDAPAEAAEDDLELREEAEIDEQLEPAAEPSAATSALPHETVLLGAEPAGSATSSLASLVQAVDRAHVGTPLGDANRAIEDMVKEVMRPMIREWLDENLPGLVDRLVRREIERLSRTAEGDD